MTLHNHFTYDCARTEPLPDGHLRLYLNASAESFIDISSAQVDTIEHLPDPPPLAVMQRTQPSAGSSLSVGDLLAQAGAQHNIDVALLASLVHTESRSQRYAVSRAGAQGIMQLMPATARELGVADSFRPEQNIAGGTAYLDALLTRYHNDLTLALAAYNAGPAAVDKYHGIPPYRETRAYVFRVETEFKRRKQEQLRSAAGLTPALAAASVALP